MAKTTHRIALFFIAYALIFLLMGKSFSKTELIVLLTGLELLASLAYFSGAPAPRDAEKYEKYRRRLLEMTEREFRDEKDAVFEVEDKKHSKKLYTIYMDIEVKRHERKKTQV